MDVRKQNNDRYVEENETPLVSLLFLSLSLSLSPKPPTLWAVCVHKYGVIQEHFLRTFFNTFRSRGARAELQRLQRGRGRAGIPTPMVGINTALRFVPVLYLKGHHD